MPAFILRPTDRIRLCFPEGVVITVAPLTQEARGKLRALYQTLGGEDQTNAPLVARETLRMTVKNVEGVLYGDGTPFQCVFDPHEDKQGRLTEQCAEELTNISFYGDQLIIACHRVGVGAYQSLIGEERRRLLQDVEVLFPGQEKKSQAP